MKQLVYFLLSALILGFVGCSMVSKLPVVGDGDDGGARDVEAPADAPPYNSDRPLGAGDLLDIAVYRGIRSGKEVYQSVDRVGAGGTLDLGKLGTAEVAGLKAERAADAIGSVFRRADKTSGNRITVHIRSINGTKIVMVDGGVGRPGVVLWQSGMTAKQAIQSAGGKKSGAGERFVYIATKGVKKTLIVDSLDGADPEAEAAIFPGDIIDVPVGL